MMDDTFPLKCALQTKFPFSNLSKSSEFLCVKDYYMDSLDNIGSSLMVECLWSLLSRGMISFVGKVSRHTWPSIESQYNFECLCKTKLFYQQSLVFGIKALRGICVIISIN